MKTRFDSLGQTFGNTLNTLQSGRVNVLEEATDLQVLARSLIEHEALRIERKLGKQHPRTLQLNARVTFNMAMIESLKIEREIAQIKAPDIPDQDALVQGRVRDENARGFAGLTVCLIEKEDIPSSDFDPVTRTKVKRESAVNILVGVVRQVTVPELIGQPLEQAITTLRESDLAVGNVSERPDERHDIVLDQKPKKGDDVPAGTEVDLVVGRRQDSPQFRTKVLELFTRDDGFQELGISPTGSENKRRRARTRGPIMRILQTCSS